jgi:hypothetical protein
MNHTGSCYFQAVTLKVSQLHFRKGNKKTRGFGEVFLNPIKDKF